MINIDYIDGTIKNVFGNKITDIEGWEDALDSDELYVPHHVLEWKYTSDELKDMNRYDNVKPEELIWMPAKLHFGNKYIHKGYRIAAQNKVGKTLKPHDTETKIKQSKGRRIGDGFTAKFTEHYGIYSWNNPRLFNKEKQYYYRHDKTCSWE